MHLRGWDDDDIDVFFRDDTVGEKPVTDEVVLGRVFEDTSEGEAAGGVFLDDPGEGFAISHAHFPEFVREGDGIAIVRGDEGGEAAGDHAGVAKGKLHHHAGGGLGGIELAVVDLFPNGGPAGLAGEFDIESLLFKIAHFLGHDERGAVGHRNVADSERRVLSAMMGEWNHRELISTMGSKWAFEGVIQSDIISPL